MPDDTELASLKREFDEFREEFRSFREQRQYDVRELASALESVGLTRRKAMTAAAIALGGGIGGAGFLAGQETARADAVGQVGTQADPLTKLWAHEIESGDGASAVSFPGSVDAGAVDIDGDPAGGFGTTTSVTPGFGSWTQADANRPVFLIMETEAETDGSSSGLITLDVDESGGTTADYTINLAYANKTAGSGYAVREVNLAYFPAGAQYQINNVSDPVPSNSINEVRELTL